MSFLSSPMQWSPAITIHTMDNGRKTLNNPHQRFQLAILGIFPTFPLFLLAGSHSLLLLLLLLLMETTGEKRGMEEREKMRKINRKHGGMKRETKNERRGEKERGEGEIEVERDEKKKRRRDRKERMMRR